jgi:hypothetical protein
VADVYAVDMRASVLAHHVISILCMRFGDGKR